MVISEYEIKSEVNSGALLRLFNSRVGGGRRQLENHHHSMIEISLIKGGSGVYTVGDRLYDIRPGDIFMFSGDEPHCITEISEDGGEMLIMNVHFEPRFIWSPGSMFDAKYMRVFFNRGADFANRLGRDCEATDEIRSLLLSMESEFERAEPEYELIIKIRLLTLLVLLGRSCKLPERDPAQLNSPHLAALDRVMEYINSNLSEPLSLDDLAARANMSRAYFSTTFRHLNGVSPWEYIMLRRIETAVALLEHSNESVIAIAGKCGFNSSANFNRTFRKITGRTPTSYREPQKNQSEEKDEQKP